MGVKISNLPAIVTPALTDIFPVVQSGVTYKETFTQLTSLFATAGVNNNITSLTGLTSGLTLPSITFNSTTGIVGTTTNDNAAAGSVGEFISSVVLIGAAVPITTTTQTNITSIALTAGDWNVWGALWTAPAAGTTTDTVACAVSQTSATLPTTPAIGGANQQLRGLATAATQVVVLGTGITRISLAAPATIYLVGFISFAVSTMGAYGFICARRVR